jgi:hypothetical protein
MPEGFEITVDVELEKVLSPVQIERCASDDMLPLLVLQGDPSLCSLEQFIYMVIVFLIRVDVPVGEAD